MPEATTVLIAAVAARALAASARRGGYAPLVADCFGDQDTVAAAHAHIRLPRGAARAMRSEHVIDALASLAAVREPAGIVCGTGFEDCPEVLAAIARRWRLLGNGPDVVARIKDPLAFAKLCRDCEIAHPETSLSRPADPRDWLMKRSGGAGGQHIRAAAHSDTAADGFYFQRRVEGRSVSALVLADGRRAMVLGFSAQWSSPAPQRPFRYGGAVQPAPLEPAAAAAMSAAVQRLVPAIPLVGLNSADFLVAENGIQLLEINPRPGATLDIFEPSSDSIFAMHVAACEGILPARAPSYDQAKASAIVYAEREVVALPARAWPAWTADRPVAGACFAAGEPLCTVLACAASATSARALAQRRAEMILAGTKAGSA
ncbi:MAG TPA: ATP-grasp domain-containing protein [Xanthobacteraceae bacterium]|jgi:predicted ATP-grasp superfamily ATP-dependent carboligase